MEFAKAISGRESTRYINGYDKLHAAMISLSISAGPRRPVVQASKNEQTRRSDSKIAMESPDLRKVY